MRFRRLALVLAVVLIGFVVVVRTSPGASAATGTTQEVAVLGPGGNGEQFDIGNFLHFLDENGRGITTGTGVQTCQDPDPDGHQFCEIDLTWSYGTLKLYTQGGPLDPPRSGDYNIVAGTGIFTPGGTASASYDNPHPTDFSINVLTLKFEHSPTAYAVADFNEDGCVNRADWTDLQAHAPYFDQDYKWDLNHSGGVDPVDYDILFAVYDEECVPTPTTTETTPTTEPTTTSTSTTTTSTTTSTTTTTMPPTTTTTTTQPPPPPPTAPFSDIAGDVHADNIVKVAKAGIAAGFSDGTFKPGLPVTRGQMATFLARALHLNLSGPSFSDIAGDAHEGAIKAIARKKITEGFPDGTFRPGQAVTREQMATFLTRAFNLPAVGTTPFPDVSGVHTDAITAVAQAGIASGFGDGTYRPALPVTRGQMASFLARALKL